MTDAQNTPQEATEVDPNAGWDADVAEALEAIAQASVLGVLPLAKAYQDQRSLLIQMAASHTALQETLAAVLEFVDGAPVGSPVHPNWAKDKATMDHAHDLLNALTPEGTP